jgi:cytochrome oxidase Cu insertion factor (SCO1/SenC/PrrC family)/thiol-disulfide isomerase/thioredoxin
MRRRALAIVLLAFLVAGSTAQLASADGDPGSDVLVYQPLFLEGDSGISVKQQVQLGDLLQAASRKGFPIRVAIVASRFDLGAVTELWRQPQTYARYLGLELALAYKGRLLVVMPNGFGFNWPGHSAAAAYRTLSRVTIGSGGAGLARAAQVAVQSLAAAAGVRVAASGHGSGAAAQTPQSSPSPGTQASPGAGVDSTVAAVAAAVLAIAAALALVVRRLRARGPRLRRPHGLRTPRPAVALSGAVALAAGAAVVALAAVGPPGHAQNDALATNPNLDPGQPITRPAPDFTLTDQFGQPVSLHSFRGKVVLLAFNDSECTTICPLTTTAMLDAKAMLGAAGSRVQLLGVDANPKATSLEDVLSYSQLHGMLHAWHFVTGSLVQLERVWAAYKIEAAIQGGEIAHTPALFVIDPRGLMAKLYITQQSYAAVGQLGQLLAQEASQLLPGHPAVHSNLSYSQITGISPTSTVALPRSSGGSVKLGPGEPRLYLFFATWDQEITTLAGQLEALNSYVASATASRLPSLTAVDEGSVEPTRSALTSFLGTLAHPLAYPVAIDGSGRVADGYEVLGQPWFVLTSATGRILWYWQVSTSGWLSRAALAQKVSDALARAPQAPTTPNAVQAELSGSPAPLARIHAQADQLLGGESSLAERIRSLRGYPIVLNVWASWCGPCQAEFGLFASASARFGRRVAFLGADVSDAAGDAHAFLAQHPVSYPSYQMNADQITGILPQGLQGTPSTIFISAAGRIEHVTSGNYEAQGALDGDVQSYLLGG